MIFFESQLSGGTFERQSNSVAKVSYWHIPNGSEYDRAEIVEVFFSDMVIAEQFAKNYSNIPEMACLIIL